MGVARSLFVEGGAGGLGRLARTAERVFFSAFDFRAGGFGRARRCLMLFLWGGPRHIDTFDRKRARVEVQCRSEHNEVVSLSLCK